MHGIARILGGGVWLFFGAVVLGGMALQCTRKEEKPMKPASTIGQMTGDASLETAIFGAGCFWGVESAFRQVEGVTATEVGYSGGSMTNPTYQEVCTDRTGHAEVVRVTYDPSKVTYAQLLEVFWQSHDPTQHNRQGPDVGRQYRSVIFYANDAQAVSARESQLAIEASGRFSRPIATEIQPAGEFYPAEEYHQQYFEKRGGGACHLPGR